MSKQHSNLLQMFNNTVAGYDRIWGVAQNVWNGITSAMVCRAFVLADRIIRKIIEEDGNNAAKQYVTPDTAVISYRRPYTALVISFLLSFVPFQKS